MSDEEEEQQENFGDLDAELDALDIDNDFSLWTSFRSRKSIASSTGTLNSAERADALSTPDDSLVDPNQLEMNDLEYWRTRIMRDEVYSHKYRPSAWEEKEFLELVQFLGMNKKKLFEKENVKWKELSQHSNILLKRGPVLCQGQERELVLLSHGFVLARVEEPKTTAFARMMISRTYEQCELYDAIEYIRSVPTMVDIVVDVDEDEEKEEEGVEVEMNQGQVVVTQVEEEDVNHNESMSSKEESMASSGGDEQEESGSDDKEGIKEDAIGKEDGRKEAEKSAHDDGETKSSNSDDGKVEEDCGSEDDDDDEKKENDSNVNDDADDSGEDEVKELTESATSKDEDEEEKDADDIAESKLEKDEESESSIGDGVDGEAADTGSTNDGESDEPVEEKKESEDGEEEIQTPVGSPGRIQFLSLFGGRNTSEMSPAQTPEQSAKKSPEKHVTIEEPPKKKQITIQEERHCFLIKTETDEFNFECATKLHKEAWLEALERVLVKTRSRARSNKDRVRGWQHTLAQTSLHSAAVTGLDDLCCNEWLDLKNELDTYNRLSPLHYAVMNNMMHIMDYLLSHGADPEVLDEDERTPMYYAQRDELMGAQCLLLEYGAKRSQLCDAEERGVLFQGAAQVAETKAAKAASSMNGDGHENHPSGDKDLKSHQQAATNAHGAMNDAMNELRIRGEKINDLAEKANMLEENVNTYGDLAKQMKARAKKKKWYNLK